jgi:hypothetical protein
MTISELAELHSPLELALALAFITEKQSTGRHDAIPGEASSEHLPHLMVHITLLCTGLEWKEVHVVSA